jgi:Carboxypeptidase regulatory-like domain
LISNLGHGSYLVGAAAPGYSSASQHVTLTSGPMPTIEIRLESLAGTLDGQITDVVSGAALAGATVSLGQWMAVTDTTGRYRFDGVPPGAYTLQVRLEGYGTHQLPATIEPRGGHTLDVTLSPLVGVVKVRVVDAATGRPIEGATISYGTIGQEPTQPEEPCADYALLVSLKRSRQYRAVRSRVSDLRPTDAWQQEDLHFFVFALNRVEGDEPPPVEAPVAVFAMRRDVQEPVSAVVVRPRADSQEAEITTLGAAESLPAPPTS